jgi:excisionase family DNA binding protein
MSDSLLTHMNSVPKNSLTHVRILRSDQVAAMTNLSKRTICLWAASGQLPAFKLGRQWRFKEEEIVLWLGSRISSSQ